MIIYKIHDTLYRLSTEHYVKDVHLKGGKIIEPENIFNALTDQEMEAVINFLNKN